MVGRRPDVSRGRCPHPPPVRWCETSRQKNASRTLKKVGWSKQQCANRCQFTNLDAHFSGNSCSSNGIFLSMRCSAVRELPFIPGSLNGSLLLIVARTGIGKVGIRESGQQHRIPRMRLMCHRGGVSFPSPLDLSRSSRAAVPTAAGILRLPVR